MLSTAKAHQIWQCGSNSCPCFKQARNSDQRPKVLFLVLGTGSVCVCVLEFPPLCVMEGAFPVWLIFDAILIYYVFILLYLWILMAVWGTLLLTSGRMCAPQRSTLQNEPAYNCLCEWWWLLSGHSLGHFSLLVLARVDLIWITYIYILI